MATPLPAGSFRSPSASRAAAMVRREGWFMRRNFIGAMKSRGLKSRTSAAACAARPAVSKRSMRVIAEGAMMPRPVMAMRIAAIIARWATETRNAECECRMKKAFLRSAFAFYVLSFRGVLRDSPKEQRNIAPAKPERIRQRRAHRHRPRRMRAVIARALRRRFLQPQRRRRELVHQREDGDHRLHAAGGAEGVAEERLARRRRRARAEGGGDRLRLRGIVHRRE